MAENIASTAKSGLQAASDAIRNVLRWFARALLLLVGGAVALAFNQDDLATVLALAAACVGAFGIWRELAQEFPIPTAGVMTFVIIKKRHAIATLMMAFVVFSLFAIYVDWRESFTHAVLVSVAYWFLIMAIVFKYKPWHMILFMFILLGIVVKGAIDLLGAQSIALPAIALEHPRIAIAAVLAACILFLLVIHGQKVAKQDKQDLEEYLKLRKKKEDWVLEKLMEDEKLKREGRELTEAEKLLRHRKDLELDALPPKLYWQQKRRNMGL